MPIFSNSSESRALWITSAAVFFLVIIVAVVVMLRPGSTKSDDVRATADNAAASTPPISSLPSDPEWERLIADAAASDLAHLMRKALAISDPAERERVVAALVTRWINTDIGGFLTFVDEAEVDQDGGEKIWSVLCPALAAILPDLDESASGDPRLREVVRRLIEFYARTDPGQALAWAREWLLGDARESALAVVAGELAQTAPTQAIALLDEVENPARRVDTINGIGAALGANDPDRGVEWASSLENVGERPYAMAGVLAAMAAVVPEKAATASDEFVQRLAEEHEAQLAADREAGISSIPEGSENDPANVELLPPTVNPQLFLLADANMAIAEEWAARDPSRALGWVAAMPENEMKEDVLQSALAGWSQQAPEAAFDYYRSQRVENAAAAETIFETWAVNDPDAAASRVNQLESATERASAISGVVRGWTAREGGVEAATAWVDRLPPGIERDYANALLIDTVSLDAPEVAWQRAQGIQNAGKRQEALRTSFASLVESNPDAAVQALTHTNLPADEVRTLDGMLRAATGRSTN